MLENNLQQLDEIMNRYGNDLESVRRSHELEAQARDQFEKGFLNLKKEIIWPAIVDVGNQLNRYGHDYHVSEENEFVDATAHYSPASITLDVYPASLQIDYRQPKMSPYISFIADKYAKKVVIMVSTMLPGSGGVVGSNGSYELEEITTDFVERKIVEVIERSLILHR
jgi:hypothetical protein